MPQTANGENTIFILRCVTFVTELSLSADDVHMYVDQSYPDRQSELYVRPYPITSDGPRTVRSTSARSPEGRRDRKADLLCIVSAYHTACKYGTIRLYA